MKVSIAQLLRSAWKPAVGILALGTLVVGCGDKASDPDAVTVGELKYPGNLSILDRGNGSVQLTWTASNNEDDFDGFNVYGMKDSDKKIRAKQGSSIELLDEDGKAIQEAKDFLALFNYDPTTKLESVGKVEADGDNAPEFSALPIHSGAADARLLPTCKNNGSGKCVLTTDANKDDSVSDVGGIATNGPITFDVDGSIGSKLTVGDTYCFTVLSSMDGGEKVSQTSSNVNCFEPKFAATFDIPLPTATTVKKGLKFDLRTFLAGCTAAGCGAPTSAPKTLDVAEDSVAGADKRHVAQDVEPMYIEWGGNNGVEILSGENSAIIDLGQYALGFNDPNLPATAPTLVIDTDPYGDGTSKAPIFNLGGYSIAGQSVKLFANHMYVIAVGDKGETIPTQFSYHWMYVKGELTGATVAVEMRLPKNKK